MFQKFVSLISCAITFEQTFYYFYMKFQRDVYCSIKYMYSEVQLLVCPFVRSFFLSHSIKTLRHGVGQVMQRVEPQMIHFELFCITWCAIATSTPNNILFQTRQVKKTILGIHPKSLSTMRLFYFFTNLTQAERNAWRTEQSFFAISGAFNFRFS